MKVLVTGGAGYVGAVLVPQVLAAGHQVRVLDSLMYNQTILMNHFLDPDFEFIRGDIRDSDCLKTALKDVDCVIHLAAIVGAPACSKNPELAKEINYDAVVQLDKLRNRSQKIIFASTGSNYGAVEGICTEDTPLNPLSVYGVTKTDAEKRLLDSGNVVVYRFATAFGLSPRLRLDLLVNDFAFQAIKNRQLIVYEKGFKRTFVHVYDMSRAMVHALSNFDNMAGNAFNVGNEELNFTKEEVCLAIKRHVDYKLHFAEVGSDPDKRDYVVSYEKIRQAGFITNISLDQGLLEIIGGAVMLEDRTPFANVGSFPWLTEMGEEESGTKK